MKRILVFNTHDAPNIATLNTFVAIFSHNVTETLKQRNDVLVDFDSVPLRLYQHGKMEQILDHFNKVPKGKYDHIISLGLRAFSLYPNGSYDILKNKLKQGGRICQFYDGGLAARFPGDVTFTLKQSGLGLKRDVLVGWAANDDLFVPSQNDELTVFVDHPHYVAELMHTDLTNKILYRLFELTDSNVWQSKFSTVRILRLTNDGIREVEHGSVGYDDPVPPYNRHSIPQLELCEALNTSHIFIPTHPESLGLTVLEAAMGGNYILSQPKHIPIDRLATIDNVLVDFTRPVNWQKVITAVEPSRTSARAKLNNFTTMVNTMLEYLGVSGG